jgi:hypothetical protein
VLRPCRQRLTHRRHPEAGLAATTNGATHWRWRLFVTNSQRLGTYCSLWREIRRQAGSTQSGNRTSMSDRRTRHTTREVAWCECLPTCALASVLQMLHCRLRSEARHRLTWPVHQQPAMPNTKTEHRR